MLSKEDREVIETARKYGLRPGTIKCRIFRLFDKDYKPPEVRYILRDLILTPDDPMIKSISRYYRTWKKLQAHHKPNSESK